MNLPDGITATQIQFKIKLTKTKSVIIFPMDFFPEFLLTIK